MNTLNHLKGNFILSGVAVGSSIFSKHFFKKEFLPVSSTYSMAKSFSFVLISSIVGKLIMDKFYEEQWIPYFSGGKNKVENEGFIGPIHGDLFYAFIPAKNPYAPSSSRWDPNKKPN